MLPSQKHRNIVTNIAGFLFFLIAVFHLVRSVLGWEATIDGWIVPLWFSWAAVIVALYLSYKMFRMDK